MNGTEVTLRGSNGSRTSAINVGTLERVASTTIGALLVMNGLKRRSLGSTALALTGGGLLYRGFSGHCPVYDSLGMSTATGDKLTGAFQVQQSITIGKTPEELYRAWRQPENLAKIMEHLAEVTAVSEDRAHWAITIPGGKKIEWEAQIVEDRPGEFLRWQSSSEAKWPNEGSVHFRPGPRDWGTVVTLSFRFDPPEGDLGKALLKRFHFVARLLAHKALQRFKSLMETGEIPTLRHNPTARTGATANAF
jgi:uncharacterized membrane protein